MEKPHFDLITRPRRLRKSESIRALVRENRVTPDDLIMPLFIISGEKVKREIPSMPGIFQHSVDTVEAEVKELLEVGVSRVILFGIPEKKDEVGSDSFSDTGVIQRAVRHLKSVCPDLYIISDICLCEYTDHGHCGILKEGEVDNDATLSILGKQAVSHVQAGVDMVAPSGMMDGMVLAIRGALDESGFRDIPIMSYSAKYASAFYGPFREAAHSLPQFGNRKGYQMDPPNLREALREVELDLEEGADIIMVKPALAYVDVVRWIKDATTCPVACYNVSGEYSMIKAATRNGWIDGEKAMLEVLVAIKRAGADIILTYFAKEAAPLLG